MNKLESGQLILPGFGPEPYQEPQRRKKRVERWYYIHDRDKRRMAGSPAGTGYCEWIPHELASPQIWLWNYRAGAEEMATKINGVVSQYPHKVETLLTRKIRS